MTNPSDEMPWSRAVSRRTLLRGALATGVTLSGAGLLAACGSGGAAGGGSGGAGGASGGAGAGSSGGSAPSSGSGAPASGGSAPSGGSGGGSGVPSYYPSDYSTIIDGAKKENGLTIYSNMDESNWQPIIAAFKKKYPWVGSITTNNLDSGEVFQKYYSEAAGGKSPASFMVSGDPTSWREFINTHHDAADYKSPELSKLPDFASPLPDLYTFSTDPILMGYNTKLLAADQQPTSMSGLLDLVTKDPSTFQGKLTTYDIAVSFGFAIDYVWGQKYPDAWKLLDKLLPSVKPEQSSGPMVEKINSGEYLAGFFLSSTVVIPQAAKSSGLLGWSYIEDGTPMMFRGMAIPKTAPQMNTAKLMLDFIMSHDGQVAVYQGGFTPYRSDLTDAEAPRNYAAIAKKIGKDKMINVAYDPISDSDAAAFKAKWAAAMKG